MAFSLFDLARKIDKLAANKRSVRRLHDITHDPHLSRDIGVPYRPRPKVRVDRW